MKSQVATLAEQTRKNACVDNGVAPLALPAVHAAAGDSVVVIGDVNVEDDGAAATINDVPPAPVVAVAGE
eukprot:CAMPEP_0171654722 /NCGR_PEP_ID=MMETSP0990-20121206/40408_1 /TAXON_ID=483369 /ORGANISM="non described non described, Strain CCMP2098" /LENGTH=69 /DNA_ID=CAMNT_0012234565 /DNA_START=177 /DNA_END=385 /DNA_ORIENTATION=+